MEVLQADPHAAEAQLEEEPLRVRLKTWARGPAAQVLGLYAIVRLVLLMADSLAAHIGYGGHMDGPLTAWDGRWYFNIATHGYPRQLPTVDGHFAFSEAGFDPVFPMLIRIVAGTGLSFNVSALIVSLLGGAATVLLVLKLAAAFFDEAVAIRSAMLFTVLPGLGAAWGMFYSESVGLAFAAGSLLLLARNQWVGAGVLGGIASATDPMGLGLVVPPLVLGIQAIARREMPRALIAAALAPVGYLGVALWEGVQYHDLFAWWQVQFQAWGNKIDFGKSQILLLGHFWAGGFQNRAWLEWVGVVAVLVIALFVWRARLPLYVSAYCAGVVVLLFVSNQGLKPRLLTWAFPAMIGLAAALGLKAWQAVVVGFAMLTPIVFLAYTLLGNTMAAP